MTQKEKAKAYDIALDKIKRLLGTGSNCSREELEHVFPELAESEDEKIRKALIKLVKKAGEGYENVIDGVSIEDAIAWLEKQGEKGTKGNDREIPFDAWSEEDDDHLGRILKELENQRQRPFNRPYLDKIESDYNWLKSLKDRVQPKQEWSEEDEAVINKAESWLDTLCDYLKDFSSECISDVKDVINKLKSLRPQSQWQPSNGQIEALKSACDEHWEPDGLDPLYTLYQDLKKLK